MVNYGASPYAISFNPSYSRGGERRPIGDVDGKGQSAEAVLLAALTELHGDTLYPDEEDGSRFLRVSRLEAFGRFVFAEFGIARTGIEGNLHPKGAPRVPISSDDMSETFVRSAFFVPEDGYELYWLNERAGQSTAFGAFERRLRSRMRDAFGGFTYRITPVADWNAVSQWASTVPVRDMTFVAPRSGGSTHSMDVNGVMARVEVRVKPKAPLKLNALLKQDGPDRGLVFGFLADSVFQAQTGVTAASVIEQGWSAKVAFDTPSGRQRSFGLDTTDKEPTLVYQVGPKSDVGASVRPHDVEFLGACADFVVDAGALIPDGGVIRQDLKLSTPQP